MCVVHCEHRSQLPVCVLLSVSCAENYTCFPYSNQFWKKAFKWRSTFYDITFCLTKFRLWIYTSNRKWKHTWQIAYHKSVDEIIMFTIGVIRVYCVIQVDDTNEYIDRNKASEKWIKPCKHRSYLLWIFDTYPDNHFKWFYSILVNRFTLSICIKNENYVIIYVTRNT